jgi:hypothetical protein
MLSPGLGNANDIPPLYKVKTKVSAKAIPIAPPLTSVDGNSVFFGLTLPRQVPAPCNGQAKASAKIAAAFGDLTATIKVTDKANPGGTVAQQVEVQGRIHDDGCNQEFTIPALTFAGPAQGLPNVALDPAGKATFTVTSNQIETANPGIFPAPRPLCPSDIFTIRHRLIINGCWYEAIFTIHHAG